MDKATEIVYNISENRKELEETAAYLIKNLSDSDLNKIMEAIQK